MSPQAASSGPAGPLAGNGAARFQFDRRYLAPILVTVVLITGQVSFGFLESWSRTFLAISCDCRSVGDAMSTSGRAPCSSSSTATVAATVLLPVCRAQLSSTCD